MITIKSEQGRFVLYEDETPAAFCRYDKNELFLIEASKPVFPNLKTALYKAVLSKMGKEGCCEAVCKNVLPEIEELGFDKNGTLCLTGYFSSCGCCDKKAIDK